MALGVVTLLPWEYAAATLLVPSNAQDAIAIKNTIPTFNFFIKYPLNIFFNTLFIHPKWPASTLAIFDYKRLFSNIIQHYIAVNLTFVPNSKYTCADHPWFRDGSSHTQSRFRDSFRSEEHTSELQSRFD